MDTSSGNDGSSVARATRVVLADDHPIVCAGLAAMLARCAAFVVVGQARSGEAALALVTRERPDIAVIDVRMPGLGGLEIVEKVRAMNLDTAFLILTMSDDPAHLARALDLDVEGYLLKDSSVDEILAALTAVARGERYVGRAFQRSATDTPPPAKDFARVLSVLTPTELVILRHLAANRTSRQIAAQLNVSVRTVQNHRANVCEKLELRGTNKLLQFALENKAGIGALP